MLTGLRERLVQGGMDAASADLLLVVLNALIVLVVAAVADLVVKRIVLGRMVAFAARSKSHWDDRIMEHRVLQRLAHIAPAVVIYLAADLVLGDYPAAVAMVRRFAIVYMIAVTTTAAFGALNAGVELVRASSLSRSLPARGVAQVAKVALFAVATVSVISVMLNRSPLLLLSGLGAMSAVMMFIFKDAILGFIAGVQLSTNRMVSRGDWIEMPSHGVDGDVIEVGLTTVKVQNFDKTITTIPTYALVSESFKNWRGMSESGGRRIKRAINIDIGSVQFCDEEMLERLGHIQHIADFVASRREEVARANREQGVQDDDYANGRRLTNVGLFRAYVVAYLRQHPMVHQDMTFLVRQLDPTEHGLPLEIYVFSRDQEWVSYEAIQADIFDHLLAMAPQFGLRIYQNPSGRDMETAMATGDAASRRAGAGVAGAATALLLALPVGVAAQDGAWPALPDPPAASEAAARLAEPRVAPLPEAEWTAAQRAAAAPYAATGDTGNALATLLHVPQLAEVVHPFLDYTTRRSTLPERHRKLLILRTAWAAQSAWLWADHASEAAAAGLTAGDLRRIAEGPAAAGWSAFEAALLGLADELFLNSSVTDATWAAVAAEYDELNLVDAVMTVAEFTTLSMLFNALGVQPDAAAAERLPADVPYRLQTPPREPALTEPRITPVEGTGLRVVRTIQRHARVAETWGGNTQYVNRLSPLTPSDRELLILRIGWNCQAEYEWAKHVGSVGRARDYGLVPLWIAEGPQSPRWEPYQVALLQAADELYRHATVSDATWDTLAEVYDTHRLISIVMTVATYRFVSMTLNAFGVQLLPDDEGFPDL